MPKAGNQYLQQAILGFILTMIYFIAGTVLLFNSMPQEQVNIFSD